MAKGRTWRQRKRKVKADPSLFDSKYVHLLKWMRATDNFKPPSLSPRVFPNTGRGLMTVKPLQPGDVLISVPAGLIITTTVVLDSDVSSLIKRCNPPITAQAALSVFLLAERAKSSDSVWSSYISMLPLEFDTITNWETEAVDALPPYTSRLAQKSLKTFYDAYAAISQCCCALDYPYLTSVLTCKKNFRWAWNVVNTRCVYFEVPTSPYIEESGKNCALIPYLDLLNHSPDAKVITEFNKVTNCFEILTLDSYRKYDQVFIKYGPHNNSELLVEYGFIIPDNPHNFYEFSFDTIRDFSTCLNIACLRQKEEILEKYNLKKNCWESCLSKKEWPPEVLEFTINLVKFIMDKHSSELQLLEPRIQKLKYGEQVRRLWQEEVNILNKMMKELNSEKALNLSMRLINPYWRHNSLIIPPGHAFSDIRT
ncbi:SET domain-containing protein 4-like [Octopus vulgaris]|uniref:SET domain-containing protein 4-like n=2 Tax=Octopus vulgaris TaxID=6645 RepID=A0AA36BT18_OCTVU|nr:SET domain-containing protein 4-like [Octopus vulgaris]